MATHTVAASGPRADHLILIESVQVIVFRNVVVFPRLIYLWQMLTLFQVSRDLCNGKSKFLVYFNFDRYILKMLSVSTEIMSDFRTF